MGIGTNIQDELSGIGIGSTGTVYIGGYTGVSTYAAWFAAIDSSGNLQWQRYIGNGTLGNSSGVLGIGVDSSENIYITGSEYPGRYVGAEDFFLAKFDKTGIIQWQKYIGGTNSEYYPSKIAFDSDNNLYFSGVTYSSSSLYPGTGDLALFKFNSSGDIQWQRAFGGSGYEDHWWESPNNTAVKENKVAFAGFSDSQNGNYDITLASLTTDGDFIGNYGDTFKIVGLGLTVGVSTWTVGVSTLTVNTSSLNTTAFNISLVDAGFSTSLNYRLPDYITPTAEIEGSLKVNTINLNIEDGNLGIGTTTPVSKLSVAGTITEYNEYQYWNLVSQYDIGTDPNQVPINQYLGQLAFLDQYSPSGLRRTGGGTDDVVVNSSGSVGIGTTNPTQPLQVQGNVRITGGIYDSNNNVGTAGSVLSSTGSGLSWIAAASGGGGGISSVSISTSTATQSQFLTFVAGTGTTTGFGVSTTGLVFNPSTGNLGIGTTNPQTTLDVRGAITVGVGTVGINTIFSTNDIRTWNYQGKSKSVTADDTTPQAVYVGAAGTAMFMLGSSGDDVNQYTLSTPYDVSTAGASIAAFSVATQETSPTGIDFNSTGTKMFICGNTGVAPLIVNGDYVHEYSLSTAWTVSSAGYTTSYNVTQESAPTGVAFGDSGSKMYVIGTTNDTIYQYTLTTPYSLATGVSYASISFSVATQDNTPNDISFKSDGTVVWITGATNDKIYEYRLGTAWDISTAVFFGEVFVGFTEGTPTGLQVIPEQNVAYIVGSGNDIVYQYNTNSYGLVVESSGIRTDAAIVLNNETRIQDDLYASGSARFGGATTVYGTLQADSTISHFGTTATLNSTTSSNTLNLATGAVASGSTKTINVGTGGVAGSRLLVTIGSATAGTASTIVVNSGTDIFIGAATSTGTASQPLQVTGGAYVSGSVGIGTTVPSQPLHVRGNARVTGAVYDSTNSPGTSGQVLQSTVSGTQWETASASGVGIRSDGTTIVGSGATILDFTGPGIATVTSSGGIATITVASEDVFIVPLSDETSNIGIGTSVIAFRAPFPMRIVSIPRANVSTAATQGRVVVDVKVAGTTILGANKIGIDTNATTSTTAAVQTTLAANPTTIADDALMTFDITGIGTGAKGLKVNLYYYKNSN